MKYKTLEEVVSAFEGGKLSKDYCSIILDNDYTPMYNDENGESDEKIFDGGTPNQLLRQALTLLDIPWEEA